MSRHVGRQDGGSALGLVLITELVVLIGTIPFYIMHFSWPTIPDVLLIAVIGTLATTGFFCLNHAFTCAPAAIVAPFHYVQMLWALFFGFVFFAETPDRFVGVGAALIIASGLWLIRLERTAADALPETLIAPPSLS
jgi:drug/metabolite transporter (DMT)-like permease